MVFFSVHNKWQESGSGSKACHPGAESSPARGPSQSSEPWPLLQHSRTEAVLEHIWLDINQDQLPLDDHTCHLQILHWYEDLHELWVFLFHCDVRVISYGLSCISIYDVLDHDFNHVNLLFMSIYFENFWNFKFPKWSK